jgi:hypothetical protein
MVVDCPQDEPGLDAMDHQKDQPLQGGWVNPGPAASGWFWSAPFRPRTVCSLTGVDQA